MALNNPRVLLPATAKDWRTLRQEAFARAPALTNGKWTDFNESDQGVAIIELLIGMVELLGYYQDRQANEVTFVNAVERKNVRNSLKLIGYDLPGNSAASGVISLSVAPTAILPKYPILIPKGAVVYGSTEATPMVPFYTLEDAVISSSAPGAPGAVRVHVIQGEASTQPEVFASDGTENQRYVLLAEGVDRSLVRVKVGPSEVAAVEWERVENFLPYRESDSVFTAFVDANGSTFVQFGDGKFGAVPPFGENIYVYPVTTLGEVGNLAANVITSIETAVFDANGNPVDIAVTNPQAMTGGADPESIESAKKKGPALFSALYRADSKADYIALTESVPGIDKANVWGEQEELHPNLKLINRVTVCFLARNALGGVVDPSSPTYSSDVAEVQAAVFNLLEERKPITTRVVFKKPEWVDVLVDALVAVDRTLYDPAIVASEVKLAIQNLFAFDAVTFGQDARLSQVSRIVSAVPGVSWARIKLGRATPAIAPSVTYVPPTLPDSVLDFHDIPVSKWQLIRVNDFDEFNSAVLGFVGSTPAEHISVATTTLVDAPTPDPMPNPCNLG